jgi:SAM-dependent methyltransferase
LAYSFDNAMRRVLEPADRVLGPFVRQGMAVLDFGCGFGHFVLGAARLVGPSGRVVAADVQQRMLDKTMARARAEGLESRVTPHLCAGGRLGRIEPVDVALAANVIHETEDPAAVLADIFAALRPGGRLFFEEPTFHVRRGLFEEELGLALKAGFAVESREKLFWMRRALLGRPEDAA